MSATCAPVGDPRPLVIGALERMLSTEAKRTKSSLRPHDRLTERRRSRTYPAVGCTALPVLKTGWATGPGPLRRQRYLTPDSAL